MLMKAIVGNRLCEVFTFNYTDLGRLHAYIGAKSPMYKVSYVHGQLENNSIVLGFGQTELPNEELDFMVKHQSGTNNRKTEIREVLEAAEEVVIFGHTLGDSDHTYFQKFFQREVSQYRKNIPINIITYNAKSKRQINREINLMTDNRAEFLNTTFWFTEEDFSVTGLDVFLSQLKVRTTPRSIPY